MTEAQQNQLIIENMDLIPTIASEYRNGEIDFEDLVAAGREGLVKAARSFDEDKSKFPTWANTKIRSAIMDHIEADRKQWCPHESDPPPLKIGGDSIEKIFDWASWGERGNAEAICERWSFLGSSPEELSIMYADIEEQRAKFEAAFISLTGAQRKLIKWAFLDEPRRSITQSASDLGVSYFRATRMLKRALKTMREVITRMENNSGSNTANGRPSSLGSHGCASGTIAA